LKTLGDRNRSGFQSFFPPHKVPILFTGLLLQIHYFRLLLDALLHLANAIKSLFV
jgi:hypothetical protein